MLNNNDSPARWFCTGNPLEISIAFNESLIGTFSQLCGVLVPCCEAAWRGGGGDLDDT